MIAPGRCLASSQGALVQRLGLGVSALSALDQGEIVERGRHVGMGHAQRRLLNSQRTHGDRLGVGISGLGLVDDGEVGQHIGHVRVPPA